jgi:tRNA pseudouridine38-40 synthase
LDKVNAILKSLTGTHNFHNFTSGRKYTDPSAKRYIMLFECSKPFIKDGHEFAVIKVKGQSFMLHQIRKMIGMVIAVVRGYASDESIELCWTANKVDVPTAPALGLMLNKLHYDKYNRKYGKDGIHKPLEWPELEERIETFKHEYIFSNIIKKETSKSSMFTWLTRMCICHFGILDPKYMRGAYTGVGRANYNLEILNGTSKKSSKV